MIKSIHFENFKVLRDSTIPLERFTLLVGPNGSGKSTVLQGLEALGDTALQYEQVASVQTKRPGITVTIDVTFSGVLEGGHAWLKWEEGRRKKGTKPTQPAFSQEVAAFANGIRNYSLVVLQN